MEELYPRLRNHNICNLLQQKARGLYIILNGATIHKRRGIIEALRNHRDNLRASGYSSYTFFQLRNENPEEYGEVLRELKDASQLVSI